MTRDDSLRERSLGRRARSTRDVRIGLVRRVAARLTGLAAMVGVVAFVVAVSVPAAAFYPQGQVVSAVPRSAGELQGLASESTAEVTPIPRDEYTVTSRVEQLRAKYASRSYAYRANPGGSIQWPFPITVPIASGFGDRLAPCSGCSSFHEGVDFIPGAGTPIGAIATGVVSLVRSDAGGLGEHVVIDHVLNGQKVQSVYAHMQTGTIIVSRGETVEVGQILGLVGSTGASTGAHLHLEIHVNGVPVDPFAWLKANTN
ncbi:M23 family metallopeptidase [Parafrigoribacterium soli]|uniref:M23 family metallopeptidase n=1 Tax=Parafrigoribacterium soli TaxID=3144663 RepID=UPI0032F085FD